MNGELVVAVFPSRTILKKALDRVLELNDLEIEHAAVVVKNNGGQVIFLDDDIGADEGGVTGALAGAAMIAFGIIQLGALQLPGLGPIFVVGLALLVGGIIGAVIGRLVTILLDRGFKDEQVKALAERLQAGHLALVLQVKDPRLALPRLRHEFEAYRAELVERLEHTLAGVIKH